MTEVNTRVLASHDVSDIVGLRVTVINAAKEVLEEDGSVSIEVPETAALVVAAAVARCLEGYRLRGDELRSIRKIAGWTASDLAAKLGEKTSPETISRWENEKQPMGGYAEKVFRLVVCEELCERAVGIPYRAKMLAEMMLSDPWKADPSFITPTIILERVKVRVEGKKVEAYEVEDAA